MDRCVKNAEVGVIEDNKVEDCLVTELQREDCCLSTSAQESDNLTVRQILLDSELEIGEFLEKRCVTVADMRKIAPRLVQQLFYSPDVMKEKQNNLWTVPEKVGGIPPEVVQVFRDPSNGTPRLRKCQLEKLIAFLTKLYREHKEKLPLSRVPDPTTREDQTVRDGPTTRDDQTVRDGPTTRDDQTVRDGQVASTSDENDASSAAPYDIPATVSRMEAYGNGNHFPARLPLVNREVFLEDITSAIRDMIRERSTALLLCATDPLIEKLENIQRDIDVDERYIKLCLLHRSLLVKNKDFLEETEVIEAEADVIQPILGDVIARKAEADFQQPTSGDVVLKGRDPTQMKDSEIEALEDHVKLTDLSHDWRPLDNCELESYLKSGSICQDDTEAMSTFSLNNIGQEDKVLIGAAPPTLHFCKRKHIEAIEHDHRYHKPPDEPATKKIHLNIQG